MEILISIKCHGKGLSFQIMPRLKEGSTTQFMMACVGLGAAHFALFTRAYSFHNHFDICKYS